MTKENNNDTAIAQWGFSDIGMQALEKMQDSIKKGSHGITSTIPILCKGEQCPYKDTCPMNNMGIDIETLKGQRCPVEVSKIMNKFDSYVSYFEINPDDVDQVVLGLIKELIDYEIQIERADRVMAKEADFLEEVIIGVSPDGREFSNREISKPIEYKERAIKKKHEILQLLNSTPKDKAGQKLQIHMDPSTYASQLLERARELQEMEVIDIEEEKDDE